MIIIFLMGVSFTLFALIFPITSKQAFFCASNIYSGECPPEYKTIKRGLPLAFIEKKDYDSSFVSTFPDVTTYFPEKFLTSALINICLIAVASIIYKKYKVSKRAHTRH